MSVTWIPDVRGDFTWTADENKYGMYLSAGGAIIPLMVRPDWYGFTQVRPANWFDVPAVDDTDVEDPEPLI